MPKKSNTAEFIIKSHKVHGNKYDYSQVEYIKSILKVCIICPIHGEFWQRPDCHINLKQGCPKCAGNIQMTTEQFITKAKKVHGNNYQYPKTKYKSTHETLEILCPKHGSFFQQAQVHLQNHGCPKCQRSIGEHKIEKWLHSQNISFIPQKRFKECYNKRSLPFDFYLPEFNICIEFDGKQHFLKNSLYYSKDIKQNDIIKTRFCKNKNIRLIRISYKENIQQSLNNLRPISISSQGKRR